LLHSSRNTQHLTPERIDGYPLVTGWGSSWPSHGGFFGWENHRTIGGFASKPCDSLEMGCSHQLPEFEGNIEARPPMVINKNKHDFPTKQMNKSSTLW